MTLNFPPTNQSPWEAPNGAIYEWDGEKWIVMGAQSIYVKKTGDEMSGDLLLKDKDGNPAVYDDTTDPSTAVNKKYVDQQDDLLLQGIIDVQEELDAIAPSTDKGVWEFDQVEFISGNVNSAPDTGKYLLLRGTAPNWTLTDEYNQTDAIVFNKVDYNGNEHVNWDLVGEDKEIILLDKPDRDEVHGAITDILDLGENGNPYGDEAAVVIIDRFQGKGQPNNRPDPNDLFLTLVNIFSPPSGGSGDEFVMKIGGNPGGQMTGYLTIDQSKNGPSDPNPDPGVTPNGKEARLYMKGDRTDMANASATIHFQNAATENTYSGSMSYHSGDDSDGSNRPYIEFDTDVYVDSYLKVSTNNVYRTGMLEIIGKRDNQNVDCATVKFTNSKFASSAGELAYRSGGSSNNWFQFNKDVDLNGNGLHSVQQIRMNGNGTKIQITQNGTTDLVVFKKSGNKNDGNANVTIQRAANGCRTFAIRGRNKDTNVIEDFFHVNTNSSNGDGINYYGRQDAGSDNLATCKYVDNKVGGPYVKRAGSNSVTIQYSNGNFLISQA